MKRSRENVFGIAVVFCAILLICLVQNILTINGGSASGETEGKDSDSAATFTLIPEDDGSETQVPASFLSTLLPGEDTEGLIPISADAHFSDLLFPSEDAPHGVDTDSITDKLYQMEKKPTILLYHTHTTEAYRMEGDYQYTETGTARTDDNEKNIVKVGETLKAELEALGFTVIHDITNHEPPKLSTSYDRSVATMERYKEQYGDEIDIYIDLHRDAADVEKAIDDVVTIDGKRCARLMFVVGKGENYEEKPNFEANYTFAKSINSQLNTYNSKFAKEIRVKSGRYNQHVGDMCLLVEVGHNANTLEEALNSIPYLAKSIANIIDVVE